jgi:hypothetical protein
MVERMKSEEDAALEALFRRDALPDNGFSRRVVARIRRRLWLRRLLVPVAVVVGSLVAVGPASALLQAAIDAWLQSATSMSPLLLSAPVLLVTAALVAALRMLEE